MSCIVIGISGLFDDLLFNSFNSPACLWILELGGDRSVYLRMCGCESV